MKDLIYNKVIVLSLFIALFQPIKAQVSEVTVEINWTSWASDNSVSVYSPSGDLLLFVCDPSNCQTTTTNSAYTNTYNLGCFQDQTNYYIIAADAYGDGWNGTGNYVRVFSGGTQVLNYNLASGSSSGQQFFNVSGGGSCPTIDVATESVSALTVSCGLDSIQISTVIRNQGTTTISSIPVSYSINGGTAILAGTYNGSISPGSTGTYSFTAPIGINQNSNFSIFTTLSGDSNPINDTNSTYSLENSSPHDFVTQGALTMGFEASESTLGWTTKNYNNDAGVWNLNGTTNPRTGANAAIYNYTASNSADDWMFTKCLSMIAGQDYKLEFYYRVQSATYPESFSVSLNSGQNNSSVLQTIQTYSNVTNTAYALSSTVFTAPSTGEYYIAWHATSAANMWNILIDDVNISKNSNIDVGVSAITSPTNACGYSSNEVVSVTIENFGNSPISNIPLLYSIDGGAMISAGTYSGTINSSGTANYNFNADLSQLGSHTLIVKTEYSGDEVPGNDSTTISLTPTSKQLDQAIFSMGFETSENFNEWTIINANGDARQWELTTASPNTGGRSVRIRNTTTAANDWLFTPCISFNSGETYVLDFSYRARTAGFSENFEVLLTSATSTTSTVSTLATYSGFSNTVYSPQTIEFSVPSAGIYYIAFRSTSTANQRGMHLDDISIYNKAAYWLGNTTDWNDVSNWSSTIPSNNSDVVIPTNPIGGNMPIVSTNTTIGKLTIQNNASITINSGIELTLNGDYNGNNNFTSGVLRFGGNTAQNISGDNSYFDLIIDNPAGVNIVSGNSSIRSKLFLNNGILAINANEFIILSDALGDAQVAEVTNGSVSGNITVQRYIDAGVTNWRFLASPIDGVDFEQWDDDMITSGFIGSDYPTFSFVSIYSYNEPTPGVFDIGYTPLANSNQIIGTGKGYMVWSGTGSPNTAAFTIDVTGQIATGNTNLNVSYTNNGDPQNDGWCLVGNPYASAIDWDSPNWIKTNISNAIYVWDPDASQYTSYIGGIGTNGGSNYIASGQAFWVQATGINPTLTATETVKTSTPVGFLKPFSIENDDPMMRLKINKNNLKDEIVVRLMNQATNEFDATLDASKIISSNPGVPAIYSMIDSVKYSINSLNNSNQNIVLPIYTEISSNGNYTLSLAEFENFENRSCITLEDQLTGIVYDLKTFSETTVVLQSNDPQPRFILNIHSGFDKSIADVSCFGAMDGKAVYSTISPAFLSDVYLKNEHQIGIDSTIGIILDSSIVFQELESGLYFLSAQSNEAGCPNLRDTFRINEPEEVYADFETFKVSEDLTFQFLNTSSGGTQYEWNFGDGFTSTDIQPIHTFSQPGFYNIVLTVQNNFDCSSTYEKPLRVSQFTNLETNSVQEPIATAIKLITRENKIYITSSVEMIEGVELLSIDGKLVLTKDANAANSIEVNTTSLSTGIYLTKVYTSENEYVEKIFIR